MDLIKKSNIMKLISLLVLPVMIWGCAAPATQNLPSESGIQKEEKAAEGPAATTSHAGNETSIEQLKAKVPQESYIPPVTWKPGYTLKNVAVKAEKSALPQFKVGADIQVEGGKISLKEVIKQLAGLKNLNVSWASDVDQDAMVDVDIKADDNYWTALENILRQLDYFYKFENNTIIVKYRDTKKYYLPVPFLTGTYKSNVGGDLLSARTEDTQKDKLKGSLSIERNNRAVSVWATIQNNLDKILGIDPWLVTSGDIQAYCLELWGHDDGKYYQECLKMRQKELDQAKERVTAKVSSRKGDKTDAGKTVGKNKSSARANKDASMSKSQGETVSYQKTINYKSKGIYYVIDRPLGIITVTAPRRLLAEVDNYMESLKKELYRQVVIEAKILEVQLDKESNTGIDWSNLLKGSKFSFKALFGNPVSGTDYGILYPTKGVKFLNQFQMAAKPFDLILNALSEHGQIKVLSNPKLSLLNGQPALVTVGRKIDYLRKITSDVTTSSGSQTVTFDTEIDSVLSGLAFGVSANIASDDEIILQVTPIISKLLGFKVTTVGRFGDEVQMPTVELRELTTMARVKSGQILVIGGLISDVTEDTGNKVPLLGDVPVVGNAFKNNKKLTSKKELIVLLRPQIVNL